jgi:anti-sigma regulatory factor (Ser/Thr protein kinase)
MHLPFSASAVSVARQRLKTWMTDLGEPQEVVEDARVVISELVANAVRHARPLSDGSILVSWAPDREGVHLSVTDGGAPTRPHSVHVPVSAVAGRGMEIVDILSRRWWTEQTSCRSTVHAVLDD